MKYAYPPFQVEVKNNIQRQANSLSAKEQAWQWMRHPELKYYSYNFSWLGRPIIQYPQDMVAMQELIFSVQPDLIIETGIAHGGSLIFYASLLELNALCGGGENGHVLGIDIDIRAHNRTAIEAHPMYKRGRITMFEGSSIGADMVNKVKNFAKKYKNIMVLLDSNHTHEHVLAELNAYAPLVSSGSYCVVFDTIVEYMSENAYPDRPWGRGDNPMTAVEEFLVTNSEFNVDNDMDAKLLISVAPKGYLKRL